MTDFVFVRHGQSQANADKIIASAESPLTKQGIDQARVTAQEVKNLGITLIACSPYLRAKQTAQTIADELGIANIQIIDELRERGLGALEDKPKTHESEHYFTNDTANNFESRQDTLDRMNRCLLKIAELSPGNTVLVVGHAVSGYYLFEAAKGIRVANDLGAPSEMKNAGYLVIAVKDALNT